MRVRVELVNFGCTPALVRQGVGKARCGPATSTMVVCTGVVAIIQDQGNTIPGKHVILGLAATQSGGKQHGTGVMSHVDCSEFLSRFSEFYDAPAESQLRRQVDAHVEVCAKCARYERAVVSGAALLQTLPRIQPSENFRSTLEHRLLHLEEENALVRTAAASVVPALTAVGMAVVLAVVAWSPMFGDVTVEVELAPIVVSDPPSPAPAFFAGQQRFLRREPALILEQGLWSDPNALLYEYSPMRQRYQSEDFLRRTGF